MKDALSRVWTDREAARLYAYRAAYPAPTFELLRRLIAGPAVILDAGCGTGALARRLAEFALRVDAIDRSEAMIDEGRLLPNGRSTRIRWLVGTIETAPLDPPYGLITCGQSLHWMDHDVVLPRFADALAPGGFLAITDHELEYAPEWRATLVEIIKRHSPLKGPIHQHFADLQRRGLFERVGFTRTSTERFDQSTEDFIRALQSTSTLSRVTLGAGTDEFAAEVRAMFARLEITTVTFAVAGNIVWGRPRRP